MLTLTLSIEFPCGPLLSTCGLRLTNRTMGMIEGIVGVGLNR
jgi:hypothetical protein